jgi:hypothetical protein
MMPEAANKREHKPWHDFKKKDIEDVWASQPAGEYYALIVKVDPEHNPISGYWVVTPEEKAPAPG